MKTKTKRNRTTKTKAELDFEKAKLDFDIAKSIFKSSLAYEKATAAQRRVMIAEDALAQLKMGRFMATPGTYVSARGLARESKIEDEVQLNTLLHNSALKSSCNVCARGALLLSAVRHRNDCTIDNYGETSEESFVKEFEDQQEVIEAAFEDYELDSEDGGENKWCEKFLSKKERDNATTRLELILKNIIRNKGTFKQNQR
jgi:hypothetical protein